MNMIRNQPDYSNALVKTEVKPYLRAKMIDWMLEVYGNYSSTTSNNTFFLAIHVLDLFYKNFKGYHISITPIN